MARLKEKYQDDVIPKLKKEFGIANPMAIPRVSRVVCNIGLGEASRNPKLLDHAIEELTLITGQRPVVRKARKSIAQFKLREGMQIGCSVTLRRDRMFEFLDRLINVALPRVRDFRGLSTKGFDGRGNYTIGLKEQLVFPEIEYEKIDKLRGLEATIVTSAHNDEESRRMLELLGMPFEK